MMDRPDGPECPRCGCRDTAITKRPTAGWMQGSGRAKCRNCGDSFAIAIPPQPDGQFTPPPIDHGEPIVEHAQPAVPESRPVRYQILLCPECGSEKTKVTNTRRPIRSHKCKECGCTFQTVEQKVRATATSTRRGTDFSEDVSIP